MTLRTFGRPGGPGASGLRRPAPAATAEAAPQEEGAAEAGSDAVDEAEAEQADAGTNDIVTEAEEATEVAEDVVDETATDEGDETVSEEAGAEEAPAEEAQASEQVEAEQAPAAPRARRTSTATTAAAGAERAPAAPRGQLTRAQVDQVLEAQDPAQILGLIERQLGTIALPATGGRLSQEVTEALFFQKVSTREGAEELGLPVPITKRSLANAILRAPFLFLFGEGGVTERFEAKIMNGVNVKRELTDGRVYRNPRATPGDDTEAYLRVHGRVKANISVVIAEGTSEVGSGNSVDSFVPKVVEAEAEAEVAETAEAGA